MKNIYEFMSDSPILTFLLVLIVLGTLSKIASAIFSCP